MSINRRRALAGSAALVASVCAGPSITIAAEPQALAALAQSPLIYLSPLVSGGRESRCHSEVWFVYQQADIFVVTWSDKWRARAMQRGFRDARIWIGDFGPWSRAKERYRTAPSLDITGRFERDSGVHESLLKEFARKYQSEWDAWDRQVRDGLANGAWAMLRYRVAA